MQLFLTKFIIFIEIENLKIKKKIFTLYIKIMKIKKSKLYYDWTRKIRIKTC